MKTTDGRNRSATHGRRFLRYLAAGLAMGVSGMSAATVSKPPARGRRIKAAAVQMTPKLGNVKANLDQAEKLVDEAVRDETLLETRQAAKSADIRNAAAPNP